MLWDKLIQTVQRYSVVAAERLTLIREDSATSRSFGPTIGSLLDKHSRCIRTAGTPESIELNAAECMCGKLFPEFMDHTVGHVRTSDTSILPHELAKWVKLGLNFRPKFSINLKEIKEHILFWAKSVLKKLRHKAVKENLGTILACFMQRTDRYPRLKALKGLDLNTMADLADRCNEHLVSGDHLHRQDRSDSLN